MSRNRIATTVVLAVAAAASIGFSTMTFGESNGTECWDEYNGRGTRMTGRLLTEKGGAADDCRPATTCFQAYNADRTRVVRRYVPMGGDPKTACTEVADPVPTTTAPPTTFPPIVTIPPPTTTTSTTEVPPTTIVVTVPPTTTATTIPATTTPVTTAPPTTATPTTSAPPPPTTVPNPPSGESFTGTFDTLEQFRSQFDFGFSGQDPASNRNSDRLVSWTGDHDHSCGSPGTQRPINIDRNTSELLGGMIEDFDQMFWVCRGHLMTAVNAVGYNIAWFSPKEYFSNVSRVCWDINVTHSSSRKWTQVLFVSPTDAQAHPSPRGSGGYDLGYTNPMFRGAPGTPSAEILPVAGDLAGLQILNRGHFRWFQGQDHWTTEYNSSQSIDGVTDKAARYTHCIEQISPSTIRFTQERPASHGGFQQVDVPGTIPQGPVKVVFQDDNYNGPKGDHYDPNVLTWHWDNIIID